MAARPAALSLLPLLLSIAPATDPISDLLQGVHDFSCGLKGIAHRSPRHESCPWNDSNLWSYIESENGEGIQADDEGLTNACTSKEHQSQPFELHRDPDTSDSVIAVDFPTKCTGPAESGSTRDVITLRDRPFYHQAAYQRGDSHNRQQSQPATPSFPTIKDNIDQINKMKANRDSPSPTKTPQKPAKSASQPQSLQRSSDTAFKEDLSTPILSDSDVYPSSSDETETGDGEPLISTAVPKGSAQDRWALVFDRAKTEGEELDRFEAALGRV
ncbi:MAG: hypothetical protein Q9213_006270 [Squamulea squamosa]